MTSKLRLIAATAIGLAGIAGPAAAEVTFERLLNPEPENWLRDHGNYANWRYSTLEQINLDTVGDLELKFIVSLGGRTTGTTLNSREEAAPVVDGGMLYVSDGLHRVLKFDVRSGTEAVPLWRFDPEITKSRTSRGVALWGNNVYIGTNDTRMIALDQETGEVVWEVQAAAPQDPATGTPSPDTQGFTAAPTTLRTADGKELVLQGESTGGQRGTRSWVGAWDVATGELVWRFFTIPAPGEPGHETWQDNHNAWRVGGGGVWQTPSFDPELNQVYYGTGDAFPSYDPEFRPGDNLFTASTIALDVDSGQLAWYFQEVPNEQWDFDTPNPRMLYEINGEKVVGNFSRDGFYYTHNRADGTFIRADQYMEQVTWTAGIDAKTGRPIDYNPDTPVQAYAGVGPRRDKAGSTVCPTWDGAPTFYPPAFDPEAMLAYAAGAEGCREGSIIETPMDEAADLVGQSACCFEHGPETEHGSIWALNVETGEIVAKHTFEIPNESGVLNTAGDVIFTGHWNGKFAAYNADTLEELWSFNLGTPITAPAITYSVDGTQYIAVVAGGNRDGLVMPSSLLAVFALDD